MRLRFASMTVGLTLGVTVAVVVACAVAAYAYSVHHFNQLLEMARTNALAEGELIDGQVIQVGVGADGLTIGKATLQ